MRETVERLIAWVRTEQPADAMVQHHGAGLKTPSGWYARIAPNDRDSVLIVNRPEDRGPDVGISPEEWARWHQALADLDVWVIAEWNGPPAYTGSFKLAIEPHPTLSDAVARYRAGCPLHPEKSVFCACPEWKAGFARLIRP